MSTALTAQAVWATLIAALTVATGTGLGAAAGDPGAGAVLGLIAGAALAAVWGVTAVTDQEASA